MAEEPQQLREPPWLTGEVDQRLAALNEIAEAFPEGAVIAMPLTEPAEGSSREEKDRWERSCDNCGTYVPAGQTFMSGQAVRQLRTGHTALIFFGACMNCYQKDL